MSVNLLLDGLLILIMTLFVPIGFWRGGVREAFVGASILLGATAANAWATYLGRHLAGTFSVSHAVAGFVVAVTMLLATTLVLGYGAGLALSEESSGLFGRVAGAVLAACNGALLIAYGLSFVDRYLLAASGTSSLDEGLIAGIFLRRFGWVVAGVGLTTFLCVVTAAVLRGFGSAVRREPLAEPSITSWLPARPVRVPRDADAGKYEPPVVGSLTPAGGLNPVPKVDRRSSLTNLPTQQSPLSSGSRVRGEVPSMNHQPDVPSGSVLGWPRPLPTGSHAGERSASMKTSPATLPPRGRVTSLKPRPSAAPAADHRTSPSRSSVLPIRERCLTCGFALGAGETYCPECGAAT